MIQPKPSNRKPYLELDIDDDGNPILPDPLEWPQKVTDKKALMRSYIVVAYHMFIFRGRKYLIQIVIHNYTGHTTGNEAAILPWTSIL